jgi:hypothetical protein
MLIGWGMFTALGGCAHQRNNGLVSSETIHMQPGTGKWAKAISEQEEAARTASKASDRMQAHLKLAHLYTSYKNPQRDYKKALKHLGIYASLKSDFTDDAQLRNWLSALKQMDRQRQAVDQARRDISKLQKTAMRLKRKNANLKKINSQLTKSNKELTKTIEMLKNIDRNIEEKRKSYSSH